MPLIKSSRSRKQQWLLDEEEKEDFQNPFLDPMLPPSPPSSPSPPLPCSMKENCLPTRSCSTSSRYGTTNRPALESQHRSNSFPSIPRQLIKSRQVTRTGNHSRKIVPIPGPDTIDRLGAVTEGVPYHHDGPYEATLLARQVPGYAPVDAVKGSNAAALAATPQANIVDCLEKHYPLQGTAMFPPGFGGLGDYEEYDVMIRDGDYKRWKHMEYKPEDRKGKGEPSYTLDELDKQRRLRYKDNQIKPEEYEMHSASRQRSSSLPGSGSKNPFSSVDGRMDGLSRLKRRFGSLKRSMR